MASSARAPSTDGARLGCSDADGLASKVAVFESLAAEFPHLLNAEGQALLAAAHDGRLSEAVLAAAADGHAAVEAAAPGTPSPTKPDAPPARPEPLEHDTPSPPPPPPAARTKGLGSEDFAQPALAVPPACAAPPPSAAQLVDAARPVAAWTGRRWTACDACVRALPHDVRELLTAADVLDMVVCECSSANPWSKSSREDMQRKNLRARVVPGFPPFDSQA